MHSSEITLSILQIAELPHGILNAIRGLIRMIIMVIMVLPAMPWGVTDHEYAQNWRLVVELVGLVECSKHILWHVSASHRSRGLDLILNLVEISLE